MKKSGLHILYGFGLLTALLVANYYYSGIPREPGAWIDVFRFPVFVVCIYIGRWLCAKWFNQGKSVWYLMYFLPCLTAVLLLWYFFIRFSLNLPELGFIELAMGHGPFFILGLVTGFLVKLIRLYTQKQLNEARAATAQKENELHQLQSQLSPHFLFNTLNNMYGISIADHQRIPKLLLKLSDLLRYSLYETDQAFVPLKEEQAYIRNYIEFEKMRISDRLILNENIEETTDASVRIGPMVLIIFIENAFKHSKNTLGEKIMIDIDLKIRANRIIFNIANSYDEKVQPVGKINRRSGLGLANVTKRLELLYGTDYQLKTFAKEGKYTVELSLKTM